MRVALATTAADRLACFDVLRELRPRLERASFLDDLERMAHGGYQLAAVWEGEAVRAVAGFRFMELFVVGKILYVDDLVTAEAHRSRGHGARLLGFLEALAREQACTCLELDSGNERTDAHRFYAAQGLSDVAAHFSKSL